MTDVYDRKYYDPNLHSYHFPVKPRKETIEALELYKFTDNAGRILEWTPGQIEIIDCILHRSSQSTESFPDILKRIEIIASTQYGKSLAVAAGVVIRASSFPEKWAIVAGTTEKAKIIMEHIIGLALNNVIIRQELDPETPLDRLRMKRSAERIVFRLKGEVRVYSAEAKIVSETSKSLMGFGCIPAGYKVLTDKGEIEISKLVKEKITDKVWSFNHKTKRAELKRVLDYQINPLGNRKLLKIETDKGVFVCTHDHPVWDGNKYIAAEKLKVGTMGLGFTNRMGFGIINQCKLSAKSAIRNFINALAILKELSITSVVLSVEASVIKVREILIGLSRKSVLSAVRSIRKKARCFVVESVWGISTEVKNIIGILVREASITTGKGTVLATNPFILGLVGNWESRINASIVGRSKLDQDLFIGPIKAENIKEIEMTGSGFVPNVIKSTIRKITEIEASSNLVYNLEVEDNHNYFIEGNLLHNSPNVVEDESSLVGDVLQATVMRMLGGYKDNFLIKIGNPFNRGHFLRTWISGTYYRIFIDYQRALDEGRYTEDFINEMAAEAMFEVLYGCKFPEENAIDSKGWLPLITMSEIERAIVDQDYILPNRRLGADIAGGGRNYSVLVARGYNVAKKLYKENEKDTMVFAGHVINYARDLEVKDEDIFMDAVGIGRGASDRVREQKGKAQGVLAGQEAQEKSKFSNLRAEMYWRAREWILNGGKLLRDEDWNQLIEIKYKVDSSGRIKIMSKEEMLKEGIDSPDVADAFILTFARPDLPPALRAVQNQQVMPEVEEEMDPYS